MSSVRFPVSSWSFVALSVLTGLSGAFIHPVMSYFFVEGLSLPPVYIGLYMVCVTVSGLVISQYLGRLADQGVSAKKLYILGSSGMVLALLVYLFFQQFWVILAAGVCLMAWGNATIPQMLTIGRQWADKNPVETTRFNAKLRAGISFSWMLGPPLAFLLMKPFGVEGAFSIAIGVAIVSMLFVQGLPDSIRTRTATTDEVDRSPNRAFWLLSMAVVLGSMGNNMYTSSLALYTLNELQLPHYTPGLLMGIVASIEIPVMMWSTKLSHRFGKSTVMMWSFILGLFFYGGVYLSTQLWQLIALQLVNALFYGFFAGVGLTLLQEQLPNRIGFTSAVYSNAFKIGVMLGASCMGLVAQFFSFQAALLGAMLASILGGICLWLFQTTDEDTMPKLFHKGL